MAKLEMSVAGAKSASIENKNNKFYVFKFHDDKNVYFCSEYTFQDLDESKLEVLHIFKNGQEISEN